MTLYAFGLTVKYAKEYWVSKTYHLTAWDRYPVTAISGKCTESRFQSAF